MSEQTPETAAKARNEDDFEDSASEPSMEDILASIRKIISDDADPLPLDGPDAASPLPTVVEAVPDTAVVADATDDDAFDLDSLLSELGEADVSSPATPSLSGALGLDDLDDISIPELETTSVDNAAVTVEDDMDQLMNELLMDMDMPSSDLPPAAATADGPVAASVAPSVDAEDDMDVVKSLMAGLTDDDLDPSADRTSDDLDLDAMMDELASFDDDTSATTAEAAKPDEASASDADDLDAMEEDIFDSILEMTLDDEIDAFDAQSDGDGPSLADIAAKADADAAPANAVRSTSVLGAELTGAETSEASTSDAQTKSAAAITTDGTSSQSPAKPAPSEMETPMPRALRSDAILDDVTESATMSAFAELNQVVEDKAILSERGPRIGDLVQDALKPMLKEWLDANIQGIVERAVAKEVQRIANGK